MDQLKENRILVAIIAGLVVAAGIYFVLSSPAVAAAAKELKNVTQKKLDALDARANAAPTRAQVDRQSNERIDYLKALYQAHRLYGSWSFPLREYLVPNTRKDSSVNDFQSQQTVYLAALKEFYETFRSIPPGATGESFAPDADPLTRIGFEDDDVSQAQKQFWILVDAVNALAQAVQSAKDDGNAKPVCVITGMKFEKLRPDPTGIYVGHQFEWKLALDVDVWPHLRAALHKPDRADLFWNPKDEKEQQKVIRRRVGVRFDRIAVKAQLADPPKPIEILLDEHSRAQEIFKANLPGFTIDGKRISLPEVPENMREDKETADAFLNNARATRFAALCSLLHEKLIPEIAPTSNYVNVTITGEAIDLFADGSAQTFWKTLALSAEDIQRVLSHGEESGLAPDDDRGWPSCDVISGEKTQNKPIQLDPLVYDVAMQIAEFKSSDAFKKYNPYSENTIRLGETAMAKLVEAVHVKLAGGTPAAE